MRGVLLREYLVVNPGLRHDHPTEAILAGLAHMVLDQPAEIVVVAPGILRNPALPIIEHHQRVAGVVTALTVCMRSPPPKLGHQ